jgi:2-polyprenyl-3-methyl-5-hydroxy-6-metoxy-1,4-benzoquinol methylase
MDQEIDRAAYFKGERVSHLYRNNAYYAHLSIYHFAAQFCQGKEVLDAGSGGGYGSAYLADHGAARVLGVDVSEEAVAFSRQNFQRPNLEYQQLDLQKLEQLQPTRYDLIFTSNVLEHVQDARTAVRQAAGLLKTDGVMVVDVPPIVWPYEWDGNVMNTYHVNIWTPRQWFLLLKLFFSQVQPYYHNYERPEEPLELFNREEDTFIDETRFSIRPISIDDYYRTGNYVMSALFTARDPLQPPQDDPGQPLPMVEGSFTRPLRPPGSPVYRVSSFREAKLRAQAIFRAEGLAGLTRRTLNYLVKGVMK